MQEAGREAHLPLSAWYPFTCIGKVAGLLDHAVMCGPPGSDRDYVFVVVPDSWTFLARPSAAADASASRLAAPHGRQPSSASSAFDLVRAASYSLATPPSTAPPTPSRAPAPAVAYPLTPPPKRACPDAPDTPVKKARLLQLQQSLSSSSSSTAGSATPSASPLLSALSSRLAGHPPASAPAAGSGSPLDSIVASTSDPPTLPLRHRMPK